MCMRTVQYLQHTMDINTWIAPSITFYAGQKIEESPGHFEPSAVCSLHYIAVNQGSAPSNSTTKYCL